MKKNEVLYKIILIFILGSIIGAYYEEILHIVKYYMKFHSFDWVSKRGLLYGPLSPIYGIGAVLIYLSFYLFNKRWYITFLLGSLLGGLYEYIMSFLQEKIWGTISWDYSHKFLNIGGRTTIPFMIFWGLLVLIFVYGIFPLFDKIYDKTNKNTIKKISLGLFIFIVFDVLISVTAVTRQTLRHKGYRAYTQIGEFCDKHYSDEYLKKIYTNSRIKKTK